ncbi:class I SAM-dependent DNA methyltransferase [Virgibacillus siamensis]|uniref:class I SAM-dependent DNA methyltransferase n=1 Tax=Virgibacillus siamensis TaxID=480071 RepID=UPI00098545FE|nr:class I SAM-dependent methyltransferase [Virgibacillus siamensis]
MGREFLGLFDSWAESYDDSVAGVDPQYKAVFESYDTILNEVSKCSYGNVLEFGVGTGNLTGKLIETGYDVIGVEPSRVMREKALVKLPELSLFEGDFLEYPAFEKPVHTIVSTYAFHHLTDAEKEKALKQYTKLHPSMRKIVFADTVFETDEHQQEMIKRAEMKGFTDLAEDLQREYYSTIPEMQRIFTTAGFRVTFEQMNEFVWLMSAVRETE